MSGPAGGSPPLLEARGLAKSFGSVRAAHEVSLSVRKGEVLGLVGANGAGKSTLIKILSGAVEADAGEIRVDGRPVDIRRPEDALGLGIVAVQQEVVLAEDQSLAENVLLGRLPARGPLVSRRRLRRRAAELLARVGIREDPDLPVAELTPSQHRLVMIATALARQPRLVILDEPTAALPQEETTLILRLVRQLADEGIGVIYISHRLHEVRALAPRVVALRDGTVAGRLEGATVTEERMLDLVGGSGAQGHVQHRLPASATAREADVALRVRGLTGIRVRDVDLDVRAGEIYGIAGLAGAGRSELLRLVFGVQKATAGTVTFRGRELHGSEPSRVRRGIGYIAEGRRASLFYGMNVKSNITMVALGRHRRVWIDRRWESSVVREYADRVSLVGSPSAAVETLSGGNQQKVLLARWILGGVDLLILDEPTAGVDVNARAEIHDALRELANRGATVLVASVEPEELVALCDRVGVMVEGRLATEMTAPIQEEGLVAAFYGQHGGNGAAAAGG
ncbi:MAG: sugar ABC transporter ATP-binding protein [Microbispora sp.]|nr:sugar ABC transporter ATP-binding protein [Microbispora sp.]